MEVVDLDSGGDPTADHYAQQMVRPVLAAWTLLAVRPDLNASRAVSIALGVLILFLVGSHWLTPRVDLEELKSKREQEDQEKASDDTDSSSLGTNPV